LLSSAALRYPGLPHFPAPRVPNVRNSHFKLPAQNSGDW
jgi:hypothetical protein